MISRIRELFCRLRERIRRFFHRRSLQLTLSVSFSLVTIFGMLGLALLLSAQQDKQIRRLSAESNERLVSQVNLNLSSTLTSLRQMLDRTYHQLIKDRDILAPETGAGLSLLYEMNRGKILNLAIFDENGQVLAAEPTKQLKALVNPTKQEWFTKAMDSIETSFFSEAHVQNLFVTANRSYPWVISLSRAIELTENRRTRQGVFLIDLDYTVLEQVFKNVDVSETEYLYLCDSQGNLIYHPRQHLVQSGFPLENIASVLAQGDGSFSDELAGSMRQVTVKTVGYTGWKIVAVREIGNIRNDLKDLWIYTLLFLSLLSLILSFVNAFVSSRIVKPVEELERRVMGIEQGLLEDIPQEIGGSHEIIHLNSAIASMVHRQGELRQRVVAEQESKRRSELDALQAQIHPHFLYNTLDSIIWMIENERREGAVKMVSSLARFFRLSLARGKTFISVQDELSQARNYLEIQHMRYQDSFEYNVSAEPGTEDLTTIKLIIQPLIENAIITEFLIWTERDELPFAHIARTMNCALKLEIMDLE